MYRKTRYWVGNLDGTWIDSCSQAMSLALMEICKECKLIVSASDLRKTAGLSKWDHFKSISKLHENQQPSFQKTFASKYVDVQLSIFERYPDLVKPLPGVVETLEKLKKRGDKIAFTTGFPQRVTQYVTKASGLNEFVDFSISADECAQVRPHPQAMYRILHHFQCSNSRQVVKTDATRWGILEGYNANVPTLGLVQHCSNMTGLLLEEQGTRSPLPTPLTKLSSNPFLWKKYVDECKDIFHDAGADHVEMEFQDILQHL